MIPIYPENFPNIDQNSDTVVIFKSLIDNSEWKRTGYCSRCGDCCTDIENIFKEFDGNYQPNPLIQVVPGRCAYFRWAEDGKAACVGRDTLYYKSGCAISPSKANHIQNWPNCTYSFEKIKDGS